MTNLCKAATQAAFSIGQNMSVEPYQPHIIPYVETQEPKLCINQLATHIPYVETQEPKDLHKPSKKLS